MRSYQLGGWLKKKNCVCKYDFCKQCCHKFHRYILRRWAPQINLNIQIFKDLQIFLFFSHIILNCFGIFFVNKIGLRSNEKSTLKKVEVDSTKVPFHSPLAMERVDHAFATETSFKKRTLVFQIQWNVDTHSTVGGIYDVYSHIERGIGLLSNDAECLITELCRSNFSRWNICFTMVVHQHTC